MMLIKSISINDIYSKKSLTSLQFPTYNGMLLINLTCKDSSFNIMNYQKIHNQIIERGQNRIPEKEKYYEKHHIIPRCMRGLDNPENLVKLTGREHFLIHWLLCRIYPKNSSLSAAFWLMCNYKRDHPISSRIYEEARKLYSKNQIGRKLSEETKLKISKTGIGKHKQSEKHKLIRKNLLRGNKYLLGYKYTEEQKLNRNKNSLKFSEEQAREVINLLNKKNLNLNLKEISKKYNFNLDFIHSLKSNKSLYNKLYNIYFEEDLDNPLGYKYSKEQIINLFYLLKTTDLTQIKISEQLKIDLNLIYLIKNNKSIYNILYNLIY